MAKDLSKKIMHERKLIATALRIMADLIEDGTAEMDIKDLYIKQDIDGRWPFIQRDNHKLKIKGDFIAGINNEELEKLSNL